MTTPPKDSDEQHVSRYVRELTGQLQDLYLKRAELKRVHLTQIQQIERVTEKRLDPIESDIEQLEHYLEEASRSNRKMIFGPNQSIRNRYGWFGFRTGKPTVKPKGRRTWAEILKVLGRRLGGKSFIRVRKEVNKSALNDATDAELKRFDLERVPGKETFFYSPPED